MRAGMTASSSLSWSWFSSAPALLSSCPPTGGVGVCACVSMCVGACVFTCLCVRVRACLSVLAAACSNPSPEPTGCVLKLVHGSPPGPPHWSLPGGSTSVTVGLKKPHHDPHTAICSESEDGTFLKWFRWRPSTLGY